MTPRMSMEEFAEMMREKFHIEAKPGAGSQAVNQGVNQVDQAVNQRGSKGADAVNTRASPKKTKRKKAITLMEKEQEAFDDLRELAATVPEARKSTPNKYENQFLIDLMILRNAVAVKGDKCAERLSILNPHAKRDLWLLWSLVDRIQTQLLATMPEKRWDYYSRIAQYGHYHLDMAPGPLRKGRTVVITDIKLAAICEAAICAECSMCLKDGKEIEQCMLREALLEASPPEKMQEEGTTYRCEYARAASKLNLGEDVGTID